MIKESHYTNPSQWHIKWTSMDSNERCRKQSEVKKCDVEIVHYQQAMALPTFTRIKKQPNAKDLRQVQF